MKIYSGIEGIEVPQFNWKDIQGTKQAEKDYLDHMATVCKVNTLTDPLVGKIAKFPVADGYAMYMVYSTRPLELIHLAVGDAWHYEHIIRLTLEDIKENIERQEALTKLFTKTK